MESGFVSAGYYLARRSTRGPGKATISASSCICDFFPDSWAIRWSSVDRHDRERSAAAFGIAPGNIDGTMDWATASFQKVFGWPNTFYSLEAARAARSEFLPAGPDVAVLGLALHRGDTDAFLRESKPEPKKPGYSPAGETGIYECVKAQRSLAPGGQHVGFELLATMFGLLTCSWLCNGLEAVCAEKLEVQPNQYGFLADYADGRRCAEYVSRDDVGAEPGLWLPWLVTLYPTAH